MYALKDDKERALEYLKQAIKLNYKYKTCAKIDEDFKILWDEEDFKKIVDNDI